MAAVLELISRVTVPDAWRNEGVGAQAMSEIAAEFLYSFTGRDRAVFVGQVIFYIEGTVPDGVLPLDGGTWEGTQYPELWAKVPAAWRSGDTFTLPDARGMFVLAAGNGRAVGDTGGAEVHTLTEQEMPVHSHFMQPSVGPGIDIEAPGIPDLSAASLNPLGQATQTAGFGQPHNNMPPYICFNLGIVARLPRC